MSNICVANLWGAVLGPDEMLCIKILSKKWKGLQLKPPVGPISTSPCSFLHFHGKKPKDSHKNTAFYRLKMGYGCQDIEQSHQLWEMGDLASSPALSLSLPCLHPQLFQRSISGTHRKACGCGWEQSATVLLSGCWSFHFLQQTPAVDWVLRFTLFFWTDHLQQP